MTTEDPTPLYSARIDYAMTLLTLARQGGAAQAGSALSEARDVLSRAIEAIAPESVSAKPNFRIGPVAHPLPIEYGQPARMVPEPIRPPESPSNSSLSPLFSFVGSRCVLSGRASIGADMLFDEWRSWITRERESGNYLDTPILTKPLFLALITANFHETRVEIESGTPYDSGIKIIAGITIRDQKPVEGIVNSEFE